MGLSSEMHSVYIERVCYFRYFLNLRRQPRTCGTAYPKPFRCPEPVRSIALLSQPAEQVADGGASCFFLTFGPFCGWHWMPVNLQLVRVLFSSRCEQSSWQRRTDIFCLHSFRDQSLHRKASGLAGDWSVNGGTSRSAVRFSGATEVTSKCHMQGFRQDRCSGAACYVERCAWCMNFRQYSSRPWKQHRVFAAHDFLPFPRMAWDELF